MPWEDPGKPRQAFEAPGGSGRLWDGLGGAEKPHEDPGGPGRLREAPGGSGRLQDGDGRREEEEQKPREATGGVCIKIALKLQLTRYDIQRKQDRVLELYDVCNSSVGFACILYEVVANNCCGNKSFEESE